MYKPKSDSTLWHTPKKELIEMLRCAEHNAAAANQRLKQQVQNIESGCTGYVKVVRCENCKHAETDKIGYYCTLHDDRVAENGFCSYGERKEIVNDR